MKERNTEKGRVTKQFVFGSKRNRWVDNQKRKTERLREKRKTEKEGPIERKGPRNWK